jgi:hypothetical protein
MTSGTFNSSTNLAVVELSMFCRLNARVSVLLVIFGSPVVLIEKPWSSTATFSGIFVVTAKAIVALLPMGVIVFPAGVTAVPDGSTAWMPRMYWLAPAAE